MGDSITDLYTDVSNDLYSAINKPLLDLVPDDAKRILDVGCGSGANAQVLKARGKDVCGVTLSRREAELAKAHCESVLVDNAETMDLTPLGFFDVLFLSHVIEHLIRPEATIKHLASAVKPGGVALVAVPNMACYHVRRRILFGNWRREDGGPFDRTHFHFWSLETIDEPFRDSGLTVEKKIAGDPALPLWILRKCLPKSWLQSLDRRSGDWMPNLCAGQAIVVARKKP